jgi:ATP-binding cassette subfamily B protein
VSAGAPGAVEHRHLSRAERLKPNGELRELKALAHLLGPYRRGAVLGIGATVLWSILSLVPAYLTKILIDDGIDDQDRGTIVAIAATSALLVVAMWRLLVIQKYHLYDTAYRAVTSLQNLLFRHQLRLPIRYHETHPVGSSVSRLTNDAYAARKLINTGLPTMITSSVTLIGSLVLMVVLDWRMAVMTLLVVPLLIGISWMYRRWVSPIYGQMRDAIGGVTNSANETLGVVGLIQSYNQEERHRARYVRAARDSRDVEYRTIVAGAIYFPATSILTATATGLLIIYGGVQVVRGNSQVGTMVAFFGYLQMFMSPIAGFSSIFQSYQAGVAALGKVFDVIDGEVAGDPVDQVDLDDRAAGSIELVDVGIEIGGATVLDGITVSIPAGATVAFVGDAASGRGEIARVLAGLDPPTTGRVCFDGVDGTTIRSSSLFEHLGFVSQRTGLFEGTIGDNLRLAVPEMSDEEICNGLERMFGGGFLESLSRGLETEVGRDGRDLPAGTRQAVVIARAVLRRPRILVLDGAVDSLDAGALSRLARARDTILHGVTIVAATNQPLIAEYADLVVVLDGGSIAEQGTPDDLLRGRALFASLLRSWRSGLTLRH